MARISTSSISSLVVAVVVVAVFAVVDGCPALCACRNVNSTKVTLCVDPSMDTFPQGVPEDTVSLEIKGSYSHRSQFHALGGNDLEGLAALKILAISHTLLDSVDENAFQNHATIQSIDFSFNRLTSLPGNVFAGLTALSTLDLTGNEHLFLPDNIFKAPHNLLQLHLSDLGLTSLNLHLFDGLDQLRYLDVSNNELTSLPPGVAADGFLRSLTHLDVSYNKLTYLGNDTVPLFKRVRTIVLADNPFECTCELQWLLQIEYRQHIYPSHQASEALVCHGPPAVAYQHLAILKPDQLVCVKPQIVGCDEVEPQDIGASFQIHCNMSGIPFPFISWKTPDGATVIGSSRQMVTPQLDLDPPRVTVTIMATKATNGTLTLMAQNVYGLATATVDILVKIPPTTTPPPTTTTITPTPDNTATDKGNTHRPTEEPNTSGGGAKGEGGKGGGPDIMVLVAVGCGGLALLLAIIALIVACRKMSKGGEQVNPTADEEGGRAGGRGGRRDAPYQNGNSNRPRKNAPDDHDYEVDDAFNAHHGDHDSRYHGNTLNPGRLRLDDMPPRRTPSPIAWDTNMSDRRGSMAPHTTTPIKIFMD